ncbi:IDEAL domain-containing protein [Bacillus coahuilensis]
MTKKEKLISKIDAALDARDRSLFLQLSSDYKELCTRYDM